MRVGDCLRAFGAFFGVALLLFSSQSIALGFDDNYEALISNDGRILVRHNPEIVIIHGEISTPIVLATAQVDNFILESQGSGSVIVSEFDNFDLDSASGLNVSFADFNADGYLDLFIELSSVGGLDKIIFSPTTGVPSVVTSVDADFIKFFDEVRNWMVNENYFEENAPLTTALVPDHTARGWYYYASSYWGLQSAIYSCLEVESHDDCGWYAGSLGEIYDDDACALLSLDNISCSVQGYHVLGYTINTELVEVQVPDFSVFNQDALDFVDIFARAQNNDFSDANDISGMEEILTDVLGYPAHSLSLARGRISNVYLGDDDTPINEVEFNLKKILLVRLVLDMILAELVGDGVENHPILGEVFSSDPDEWLRHQYRVESTICNVGEDTIVTQDTVVIQESIAYYAGPFQVGTIPIGTIKAEHCTKENVFCWAKRRPAPRADETDDSLATNRGDETLGGLPRTDRTDPIVTWIDDESCTYRNETMPGHILHDPSQVFSCADFDMTPTLNDVPDRCSVVDRHAVEIDGTIQVLTTGQGYNPVVVKPPVRNANGTLTPGRVFDMVTFNEVGGGTIFRDVDIWVQEQLMLRGACPLTD